MDEKVKLKVVRENGEIVTLELEYPTIMGRGKILNHMLTIDLVEHFFTKEGYYDGWGRTVSPPASMQ